MMMQMIIKIKTIIMFMRMKIMKAIHLHPLIRELQKIHCEGLNLKQITLYNHAFKI